MERLPHLEEDEVGDIHDVVDRVQADGAQVFLQPLRGRSDLDATDGDAAVARSAFRILYLDRNRLAGTRLEALVIRDMQLARTAVMAEPGIQVARHAEMGGGIDPVGRDFIFDDRIGLETEVILGGRTDDGLIRKDHDSGMVGTDAQFILRADHAERFHTADLGFFDLEIAREDRPDAGEKDFLASRHVRGTTDDLDKFRGAVIYLGDMQVIRIRMIHALHHFRHDHTSQTAGNFFLLRYGIDFDADGGHRIRHLLRGQVAFQVFFEPTVSKFHISLYLLSDILAGEKRTHEFLFIKNLEIINPLSDTDELDRDLELVHDAYDDTTLGGAVQLGDSQGGHIRRPGEFPRLLEGILASCRIEDEEHVVRAVRNDLADDVADLGQLVHQVNPVVQTAGRIDQYDISALRHGTANGVIRHGSGIGAHRLADDIHPCPVCPDLELVHRSGPEGVRGTDDNLLALGAEGGSQLADGRGLAHAVDADHQYHIGLLREVEGFNRSFIVIDIKQLADFVAQQLNQFVHGHVLILLNAVFQVVDKFEGCIDAHIGRNQRLLNGIEDVFADLGLAYDGPGEFRKEILIGLSDAFAEQSHNNFLFYTILQMYSKLATKKSRPRRNRQGLLQSQGRGIISC